MRKKRENLHLLCDASNLFHHRPLRAPAGPASDFGRHQGKGLKKNVSGTRTRDCNRETCRYTVSQSHECLEKKEVQDGKGLKEALDSR